MPQTIGTFKKNDNGNFDGVINTLSVNTKASFVPNDKTKDNQPNYKLITSSGAELGGAWEKISKEGLVYHQVSIDAPELNQPIYASLFLNDDNSSRLVWSRHNGNH